MKSTPSSGSRRRTASASSRSSGVAGGPQIPGPVMRIAPKPRRVTVSSPPMANVPAAVAVTFTAGTLPAAAAWRTQGRALRGIQLELDAADLDVVARREAGLLERVDHADALEPALEVGHRLLVLDVVAQHEPVDPL